MSGALLGQSGWLTTPTGSRVGAAGEACCYQSATRCSDEAASNLYFKTKDTSSLGVFKYLGTCYHLSPIIYPCLPAGGTLLSPADVTNFDTCAQCLGGGGGGDGPPCQFCQTGTVFKRATVTVQNWTIGLPACCTGTFNDGSTSYARIDPVTPGVTLNGTFDLTTNTTCQWGANFNLGQLLYTLRRVSCTAEPPQFSTIVTMLGSASLSFLSINSTSAFLTLQFGNASAGIGWFFDRKTVTVPMDCSKPLTFSNQIDNAHGCNSILAGCTATVTFG